MQEHSKLISINLNHLIEILGETIEPYSNIQFYIHDNDNSQITL